MKVRGRLWSWYLCDRFFFSSKTQHLCLFTPEGEHRTDQNSDRSNVQFHEPTSFCSIAFRNRSMGEGLLTGADVTTPTWAALSVQQQHSEETPVLSVLGPPRTVHSLYSNGSGPQMLLPFIVFCTFDTLRPGTLPFPLGGCVSARRDAAIGRNMPVLPCPTFWRVCA